MRFRVILAMGIVGAWAVTGAACSGSATSLSTPPSVSATSSSTPPSGATSASVPATASASSPTPAHPTAAATAAGTGHVWVFGDEAKYSAPGGAQGSGCAPTTNVLPDGAYFGYVKSWSTSQVGLDLACWYSGAAGEAQAAAHGMEFTDDYFVTNVNPKVWLLPVAGDIPAKKAASEDGTFTLSQVIADPGGSEPTNSPYPAWVFVNGGLVTELEVQFVP